MFGGEVGVEGMYMCTGTQTKLDNDTWLLTQIMIHVPLWHRPLYSCCRRERHSRVDLPPLFCGRVHVSNHQLHLPENRKRDCNKSTSSKFCFVDMHMLVIIDFTCRRRERENVTNPPPCSVLAISTFNLGQVEQPPRHQWSEVRGLKLVRALWFVRCSL